MVKFLMLLLTVTILSAGCPVKTTIPVNAKKYIGLVYKESKDIIPNTKPYYFGALIEQESCVRLCGTGYYARRCWSPKSELKTKREQGVGFGQITRAWNKRGQLRFDTLANLKRKYPKELHELTWDNIKQRPDLQIKAMILLWKDGHRYFSRKIPNRTVTAFADSAYNGGFKYLNEERTMCKLTKNCDPNKWFGNVELMKSARSKRKLYGNKTAFDINREHVRNVLKVRLPKYQELYEDKYTDGMYQIIDNKKTIFYGE